MSVHDSIHAPLNRKAVAAAAPRRSVFASSKYDWSAAGRGPSPAPSVVSVAPTLGDDGWLVIDVLLARLSIPLSLQIHQQCSDHLRFQILRALRLRKSR
ncbi:hypothetical protein EDB89DRAFT_2021327 [Lactarius sanguifluus]|nr:hypothetical protein EDB89DRAFT_2021327 [Lactarius sanguifluus]